MVVPIFNRYERKYVATIEQRDILISYFKDYLEFDPYSIGGKSYTIYNIYFDTHDYSIIRNSISKPKYKDKLRLRTYTYPIQDEDIVFLEIKKKFKQRVNKRRLTMTYKDAKAYLDHGVIPKLESYINQQIFNEIDYFIRYNRAKPGSYIRYDRIAFVSKTDNFRITFDSNLIFRSSNVNLENNKGIPIMASPNLCVMEIKSEDNFPLWLVRKLSELKLYSQSFSKYGKAYENHLIGGQNEDFVIFND
jgi:SPX domain protein involved in polyphosphate accumulation